MNIIFENLIPEKTRTFVNNIKVKDLKIIYSDEKFLSEIRRYILKHLQNLDIILINIKITKAVISEAKS